MPVDLLSPVLCNMVFELRYDYGFEYFDNAGRVTNEILSNPNFPGWDYKGICPAPSITLSNDTDETVFNFGIKKLDLGQRLSINITKLCEIDIFAKLCDDFSQILIKHLNLREFSRIGFRLHQLFKTETLDEAKEYIKKLKKFALPKLDEGNIEEIAYTIIISEKDWESRIAIVPVEQDVKIDPVTLKSAKMEIYKLPKGQKEARIQKLKAEKIIKTFPQYAVLVDVDSYVEDPPMEDSLKIIDFVKNTYNESLKKAKKYLEV